MYHPIGWSNTLIYNTLIYNIYFNVPIMIEKKEWNDAESDLKF